MQLKPGVRLLGIRPELIVAMLAAEPIWQKYGAELVVTSAIDGTHKRSSEHYSGCAVDLRVSQLTFPQKACDELRAALGGDFDVILENPGTPNQHCHCEYQPKLAY